MGNDGTLGFPWQKFLFSIKLELRHNDGLEIHDGIKREMKVTPVVVSLF
jgi:hypothetical protein